MREREDVVDRIAISILAISSWSQFTLLFNQLSKYLKRQTFFGDIFFIIIIFVRYKTFNFVYTVIKAAYAIQREQSGIILSLSCRDSLSQFTSVSVCVLPRELRHRVFAQREVSRDSHTLYAINTRIPLLLHTGR